MSNSSAAALQAEDLTKEYAAGYSDKLAKALKQRVEHKVTTYFGFRGKKKDKANMMQKLVSIVEDLVERGYVKGFLCGFSGLELPENDYVVVIYPALTDEGVEYAKSAYADLFCSGAYKDSILEEGGTPTKL